MTDLTLKVARIGADAKDVVRLELAHPEGAPLPAFEPGAHVPVHLPGGLVRHYSLCGDWRDRSRYVLGVGRAAPGRGGSEFVHSRLREGMELRCGAPANNFRLAPDGTDYLLIAGGIGITPLLSMIAAADAAGMPWTLAYAGRRRESMAYLTQLEQRYGSRVQAYPATERRLDLAAALAAAREERRTVHCCGPTRMIDAVAALSEGAPAGSVRFERFVPKAAEPHEEVGFEVEVGGQLLAVPPDRSILEVCEEAGMLVLSSCREGTCGTCETPLLEGRADHRDSVLTPAEQAEDRTMMICVSRALSPRLVLDL
jgi:ferredoxin-NADP reductase